MNSFNQAGRYMFVSVRLNFYGYFSHSNQHLPRATCQKRELFMGQIWGKKRSCALHQEQKGIK